MEEAELRACIACLYITTRSLMACVAAPVYWFNVIIGIM